MPYHQRNATHLLVLVRDLDAANHHGLSGLFQGRHAVNVESVSNPNGNGFNVVGRFGGIGCRFHGRRQQGAGRTHRCSGKRHKGGHGRQALGHDECRKKRMPRDHYETAEEIVAFSGFDDAGMDDKPMDFRLLATVMGMLKLASW